MIRPLRQQARICVVMPLLNEAAILPTLVEQVRSALAQADVRWKIILVNDGSTDASSAIIDSMAAAEPRIVAVHLSRNFGHQAALQAGLCHADGDAVIVMDSDGQDTPLAISPMIQAWLDGDDVVYAVRFQRKEGRFKRFLFRSFYRILASVSSTTIPKDAGNFGLMDRAVVDQIRFLPESERFFPGLRSWVGYRQKALAVERLARHDAKPRVSFMGLVSLARTAFFGFSRLPLLAFYWLALISGMVSVACIGYALFHKLGTGMAIPGWASMTSVTSFFGAINSLGIAILGEYIARIYDQVRGRPMFIVARTLNAQQDTYRSHSESQVLRELDLLRLELASVSNAVEHPHTAPASVPGS